MTAKTKAAWHRGNDNHAKANPTVHDTKIITDYERAVLIAGIMIAVSFGLMFIHAVVLL